jgi:energy-coupling factor transporter ATP-binding protein EcfA2
MDAYSNLELLCKALESSYRSHILITGECGSGKTHLITTALKMLKGEHGRYATYSGDKIESVGQLTRFFDEEKEQNSEYIIFDNVDYLSMDSQICLQLYLDYHREKKENYAQLLFTSSRSISELRDHRERLFPGIYDRISEIIFAVPTLANTPNLWENFKRVWNEQDANAPLPLIPELRQWLTQNVDLMKGNFRDLIKLATRWQFYRKFNHSDVDIFSRIKSDFVEFGYGAIPSQQTGSFAYALEDGLDKMVRDFRYQACVEAMSVYPTQKKAANGLKISLKTISRILSGEVRTGVEEGV